MAFLDQETQKVVVRVVYDGPAEAGKTTNVQALCGCFTERRRSELLSPGTDGDRTMFLDWLRVDTGLVAGRQLSCQFITVPGQRVLSRRRNLLVSLADVLVFVLSADRELLAESVACFHSMKEKLVPLPPLVIQLNKTDIYNALTPKEAREALGLTPDTPLVSAQASEGTGVRETAVLAIREAADAVQTKILTLGISSLQGRSGESNEILSWIKTAEQDDGRSLVEVVLDARPLPQSSNRLGALERLESILPPGDDIGTPQLPHPDVASGMIWPANRGRETLRRALLFECEPVPSHSDFNRVDAGLWSFFSRKKSVMRSTDEAKAELLHHARVSIQLGALTLPTLVWSVSHGTQGGAWLWSVSKMPSSLDEHLQFALQKDDFEKVLYFLEQYLVGLRQVSELHTQFQLAFPLGLHRFGLLGESLHYLQTPHDGRGEDLGEALVQPLNLGIHKDLAKSYLEKAETYFKKSVIDNLKKTWISSQQVPRHSVESPRCVDDPSAIAKSHRRIALGRFRGRANACAKFPIESQG